jgi:hypothetical protein
MSNVALLMSIRDQLEDSIAVLKARIEPQVITDEKEMRDIWGSHKFTHVAEYVFEDLNAQYLDKPPSKVRYWPQLVESQRLLNRIKSYIVAAQSHGE